MSVGFGQGSFHRWPMPLLISGQMSAFRRTSETEPLAHVRPRFKREFIRADAA